MKRIEVTPKKCKHCRRWMERKRHRDGRLEKPTKYAVRDHCNPRCRGLARATVQTQRKCLYDGVRLTRKTYASGRMEARARLIRRSFCNDRCRRLWDREQWVARALKSFDRPLCRCCAVNPVRASFATNLCAVCAWWQKRSAEQWLNRVLPGRRERTHRTNLRKHLYGECEHARIRGACRPCRDVELQRICALQDWRRRRNGRRLSREFRQSVGRVA